MGVYDVLLVFGVVFVGCNILSFLMIVWFYGHRVLETLQMPVYELVDRDLQAAISKEELSIAQGDASV